MGSASEVRQGTSFPQPDLLELAQLTECRHLHDGLVKIARENGVHLIVGARISDINHSSSPVTVKSDAGRSWDFDVLIGSDGLNSVVRKSFLPDVKPKPPTGNSAFRAIVPMERVRNDPLTRDLTETSQMDIWMGANLSKNKPHGYIISYPISGGRDFNMVLSVLMWFCCAVVANS